LQKKFELLATLVDRNTQEVTRTPLSASSVLLINLVALIPGTLFLIRFIYRSFDSLGVGDFVYSLFDDAMISMSYGRTLAETGQFVWFPGADPVAGITNPLWSMVMALAEVLTADGDSAIIFMTAVSGLIILLSALISGLTIASFFGRSLASVIGGSLLAALTPFLFPLTFWSLRGMETGLVALCALVLVISLSKYIVCSDGQQEKFIWLVVAIMASVIGVLTRLDFFILSSLLAFIAVLLEMRRKTSVRGLVVFMILSALSVFIVLLAQRFVWGDWLPNTYFLKVEGFSLLDRVTRGFASALPMVPFLMLVFSALVISLRFSTDTSIRVFSIMSSAGVIAFAVYNIWVGGDAWEWLNFANRFLTLSIPIGLATIFVACLIVLESGKYIPNGVLFLGIVGASFSFILINASTNPISLNLSQSYPWALFAVVLGLLGVLAGMAIRISNSKSFRMFFGLSMVALAFCAVAGPSLKDYLDSGHVPMAYEDAVRVQSGKLLKEITSSEAVIAVLPAGSVPYFSERISVDLLGKNDRVIARLQPNTLPPDNPLSEFLPGHNKWNYAYSIQSLEPDVVYEPQRDFVGFESLESWGYVPKCLPNGRISYFRLSSDNVGWDLLDECTG
jgi:hypothetical protein